jgi:hypothetical protein
MSNSLAESMQWYSLAEPYSNISIFQFQDIKLRMYWTMIQQQQKPFLPVFGMQMALC